MMLEAIVRAVLPAGFLLLTGRVDLLFFLGLTLIPSAIFATVHYAVFRWRLDDDALVVRKGWLFTQVRKVPYHRIQNVDLVRNPLHRWLGVAEAKIQTASGREPEAHLKVLATEEIERIRARVFEGRAAGASAEEGEDAPRSSELLSLGAKDLAIYGLISNRGMVIVAAAVGVIWQLAFELDSDMTWLRRSIGDVPPETFESITDRIAGLPRILTVLGGVAAFAVALALVRILSIPYSWLRLWNYRLTRSGDDLRTRYGSFTSRAATIPRHRIQRVTVRRSWLHRVFNRAEIRVVTAGGRAEGEKAEPHRRVLVPIVRDAAVPALLDEIVPGLDVSEARDWRPVDPRAFGRVFRRRAAVLTLAAAAATPFAGGGAWWAWIALLVPLALLTHRGVGRLGWDLDAEGVYARKGWWERTWTAAAIGKIQVVGLWSNPFDRRYGMARFRADTAGGAGAGVRIEVPYLSEAEARSIFERLAEAAGRRRFRW